MPLLALVTALHIAAFFSPACTAALLRLGASPHAVAGLNWTPLHFARDVAVVEQLVAAGADVNARDRVILNTLPFSLYM
mgnify:CR=1 FL=1